MFKSCLLLASVVHVPVNALLLRKQKRFWPSGLIETCQSCCYTKRINAFGQVCIEDVWWRLTSSRVSPVAVGGTEAEYIHQHPELETFPEPVSVIRVESAEGKRAKTFSQINTSTQPPPLFNAPAKLFH